MLVHRRHPWFVSGRVDNDFDRLISKAFGQNVATFAPAADVVTKGEDVVITLAVPGVDPTALDVTLHGRELSISGQRKQTETSEGDRVIARGLRHGKFTRSFSVPAGTTPDQISAELDNGLLTVRVAQVSKPQPQPHKIAVDGAGEPAALEVDDDSDKA